MKNQENPKNFYIVGIGASAGGLDALEKFFSHAPADSGLAFVVIQHLSPDYKSLMANLLGKRTEMTVQVTEDGMPVQPDNVLGLHLVKMLVQRGLQGQLQLYNDNGAVTIIKFPNQNKPVTALKKLIEK